MIFKIDRKGLEKQFRYSPKEELTVKLTHTQPKKANFLFFDTKFNKDKDLVFDEVIGNYSRRLTGKMLEENIERDALLEGMLSKINNIPPEKRDYLLNFFKEIFFEENELLFTHPKLMFYLKGNNQGKISDFISDIYSSSVLKENIREIFNKDIEKEDIFLKMLLNSLGELKDKKYKKKYENKIDVLCKKFQEDMIFLENQNLLVEELELFLKYYYFIYISQFSLKVNKFYEYDGSKIEDLYFNLNWEKASKTRISYEKGWKLLEKSSRNLFSHRTTLEMLNWFEEYNGIPLLYNEIIEESVRLTIEEKESYNKDLEGITKWYMDSIGDISWLNFTLNSADDINEKIKVNIKNLFRAVDYQFKNSKTRNKPYNDYPKWLTEFSKSEFCKKRGSLGYTLNLNQDIIFLLTKLAIGEDEKIRISELYERLKERGVFLDKDSKESLKDFYEKLNILDKKSDSGDAIYVKSIL